MFPKKCAASFKNTSFVFISTAFALVFVFAICEMFACAQDTYDPTNGLTYELSIDKDVEPQVVTISGKTGDQRFKMVSLQVLAKDKTVSDLLDAPSNALYYSDGMMSDDNGRYEFTYKLRGESGTYMIRLAVEGVGVIGERTYTYHTKQEILQTLGSVNDGDATAGDFAALLKDKGDFFDADAFATFPVDDQNKIASLLLLYRNKLQSKSFVGMTEATQYYKQAVLVNDINNAANASQISLILSNNTETLSGTTDTFKESSNAVIAMVLSHAANRTNFVYATDFIDYLNEQAVLVGIEKVTSWKEAQALLDGNAALIELAKTNYSVANKEKVAQGLAGKYYTDFAALRVAVDTIIASGSGVSSGGSGGSSGGSGGGANAVSMPISKPQVPEIPDSPQPGAVSDQLSSTWVFDDMDNVDWAKTAVDELRKCGIVNGRTEKTFAPNDTITREEFTKIMIETLGLVEWNVHDETSVQTAFADVDRNAWYYKYVSSAVTKGIIKGREDGSFGVGEIITRQDMAVIAFRALEHTKILFAEHTPNTLFADDTDISEYAGTAIYALREIGIITGMDDGTFKPQHSLTRAEAAVIAYRIMTFIDYQAEGGV